MNSKSEETDSVRESFEAADCDDSEKTNATVIDSSFAPLPTSVNEATLLCAGDTQELDFVDWDTPQLLTDLDAFHDQLKLRIKQELQRLRTSEDASTARLLQQERNDSLAREADTRRENEQLRAELDEQNKALAHKDEVIKRLVGQIRVQKERVKLAQVFANWRATEELRKRHAFCAKLAQRHATMRVQRSAMIRWKNALETTWKERVQRVCRAKAEEVCVRLAAECEETTRKLSEETEELKRQLRVNEDRQQAERENLRAAVMRGVCALNLETIGLMRKEEEGDEEEEEEEEEEERKDEEEEKQQQHHLEGRHILGVVARQRVTTGPVLRKSAPFLPLSDSMTNPSAVPSRHHCPRHRPIAGQEEPVRRSNPSAAAAVLVERHHPVNKRTAASLMANHERGHRGGVSHLPM